MGFGAPKPDPKIQAEQDAEAQRSKLDRISTIQDQLGEEDQLRAQIYGTRGTGDQGGGGGNGGGGFWGGGGGGGGGRFDSDALARLGNLP